MFLSLIITVVLISIASGFRTCDDCMKISECSQAVKILDNNESQTFEAILNSNLCGSDAEGKLKVCCSGFPRLESFENHPNLHLLPNECGQIKTTSYYPWLVRIFKKDNQVMKFRCVGSVINSRYVLTTATCIKNINIVAVRVCSDVDCETNYQVIAVTDVLIHENYTLIGRPINNIGLLRLKKPVNSFSENAVAICLPISVELQEVILYGTKAIASGWQRLNNTRNAVKFQKTVTIYTPETCDAESKRFEGHNEMELKKQLCAEDFAPDSCWDNASGVLMVEDSCDGIKQYFQYGIFSTASAKCRADRIPFYTDVRVYMKWILDNIKE